MARWICILIEKTFTALFGRKVYQEEGSEMCTVLSLDLYCTNFKCPNNLFWEDLKLNREKIRMTDKALEIRNCCCLIMNPWTPEEISEAWGLTKEEIGRSEEEAFRKLQKRIGINRKRPLSTRTLNREVVV
jgi:hypothetical protein